LFGEKLKGKGSTLLTGKRGDEKRVVTRGQDLGAQGEAYYFTESGK